MIPEFSMFVFKLTSIGEIVFGLLWLVMLLIEWDFSFDVMDYRYGPTVAFQSILMGLFIIEFVGFFGGILFQWFF